MLVRAAEAAELRSGLSRDDFAAALDQAYRVHEADPLLQSVGHLRNWLALLSDTKQ